MSENNLIKKRIAMVGLGDIAQKAYLPIIAHHPLITPVLCSRNINTLSLLADKYRIEEVFDDYQMLLKSKPDAIMIHAATSAHYHLAKLAIEHNIAVYVDKPLSDNIQQVNLLIQLAEQYNVLIYVGFNRRFSPLVQQIKSSLSENVTANKDITVQKNRFNLPAAAETFIFDDFIHVIDTVRYLEGDSNFHPKNINVMAQFESDSLANLQVSWQSQFSIVNANMNRIAGINQERLSVTIKDSSWQVDNLNEGEVYQQQQFKRLSFNDWEQTLYKRGFVSLIEDWLQQLQIGLFNKSIAEDILITHQICDQVLKLVSNLSLHK